MATKKRKSPAAPMSGTSVVAQSGKLKFRRAQPLLLYWQDNKLVFENYGQQTRISAEPATCLILQYCGKWRTLEEICAFLGKFSESSVLRNLKLLCHHGILEQSDEKPHATVKAMESWTPWNPIAGYFHFSTKDAPFAPDPIAAIQDLLVKAEQEPMPRPVKRYPKARKLKLPRAKKAGEFPSVLRDRRTWRIYGKEAVPMEALAETLQLTFGIQGWVNVPGLGRAAMKTSPSCGCLHPIEAYVVAQRVNGLKRGIYHYNAEQYVLEWLGTGISEKALEKNLGHQWWFAKGAFFVVMAAVFRRTRWKYEFPRVYRGILIEAGHLCQTFCLTATWLGLAPFCTIAYQDTQWESWLGIDGVNESVLYIAGAGTRPAPSKMRDAHLGMIGKAGSKSLA